MSLEIARPWTDLDSARVRRLPAQLGVYEIADVSGRTLFVGFAGGRSAFGLRGVLMEEAERPRDGAARFRYEVTMQYGSRWEELLMVHVARVGELPRDNAAEGAHPRRVGRLSLA